MDWTDMELSSPPKPTRIVDCLMPESVEEPSFLQTKNTTPRKDLLAEQVGEVPRVVSLPALAGEVAVAQKQQISELSKKQEVLEQLKVN